MTLEQLKQQAFRGMDEMDRAKDQIKHRVSVLIEMLCVGGGMSLADVPLGYGSALAIVTITIAVHFGFGLSATYRVRKAAQIIANQAMPYGNRATVPTRREYL